MSRHRQAMRHGLHRKLNQRLFVVDVNPKIVRLAFIGLHHRRALWPQRPIRKNFDAADAQPRIAIARAQPRTNHMLQRLHRQQLHHPQRGLSLRSQALIRAKRLNAAFAIHAMHTG